MVKGRTIPIPIAIAITIEKPNKKVLIGYPSKVNEIVLPVTLLNGETRGSEGESVLMKFLGKAFIRIRRPDSESAICL